MKMLTTILILFLFFSTCNLALSIENEYMASVKIDITASDKLRQTINSYLKRQLRGLNDVKIVEKEAEWEIKVLAYENYTISSTPTVIISTVILRQNKHLLETYLAPKKCLDCLKENIKTTYEYADNIVIDGKIFSIEKLCNNLVTSFDIRHLEKSRKTRREIMDLYQ